MSDYSYFRDVDAECQTCGARWAHKGAQGTAAVHARKHGHVVTVEISMHITYGPKEARQKLGEKP